MDYTFYYTVEPKFESVTKEKFEEFIKQYPRQLEANYCGIYSPPLITYNDLELADRWPHSVVAHTSAYDSVPWDYSEYDEVYICGLCTDICVISNALRIKQDNPNVKVTVLSDLCAGTSVDYHNAALAVMKSCLINVVNSSGYEF